MKLKDNQKTYVHDVKENERKWYLVDVKGKTLGQIATKLANIIRGKDKPLFTPQLDCGDYVVVLNAKHIRLAGSKMDTKMYYWHTQYPGGLRSRSARKMLQEKPESVLYDAVRGMLPRNKLRKFVIKKLRVFSEETHTHKAQKLQTLEL
ncbi:MAG: 50S ribosomal protein L13 [Patescibacteria group bacterium]